MTGRESLPGSFGKIGKISDTHDGGLSDVGTCLLLQFFAGVCFLHIFGVMYIHEAFRTCGMQCGDACSMYANGAALLVRSSVEMQCAIDEVRIVCLHLVCSVLAGIYSALSYSLLYLQRLIISVVASLDKWRH